MNKKWAWLGLAATWSAHAMPSTNLQLQVLGTQLNNYWCPNSSFPFLLRFPILCYFVFFFFLFNHFHARDPKIFNDMLCAAPNLVLKHWKLLLRWWWYEVLQYRKFIVFISIQYSCIYIYFLIVKVKYFSKRTT